VISIVSWCAATLSMWIVKPEPLQNSVLAPPLPFSRADSRCQRSATGSLGESFYCARRLNLPRRTTRRVPRRIRQPLTAPPVLNQTWAFDFMTETLYDGRRVRLLTMIDEGNLDGLEIAMGLSLPSRRVIRVLDDLVAVHGYPSAVRVDNGPEFRSAADPPDANVRRGTETIRELRAVMLDVTDVHELMLQLRHAIPTETALRAVEIERVHRLIDDAIAEGPVLEHLRLRIGVARDPVIVASMLRPRLKRRFVALQIQVRKEQRVIRQLPERVLVIGA
jgi:hypothetical protein